MAFDNKGWRWTTFYAALLLALSAGGPDAMDGNLLSANGGRGLHIEDAFNTYLAYNGVGIDILGDPRLPNGGADLERLRSALSVSWFDGRGVGLESTGNSKSLSGPDIADETQRLRE